ncbi:MAG: hypothetical protein HFI93_10935 [Lachnospiraceae bacterium]|nr:hypothetical protein [Lachnospiraceae bacterium]
MDRILRSSFTRTGKKDKGQKASFLKELYDGKLAPAEQICPADPEYWRLCREAGQEEERLKKMLGKEAPRLEEMRDKYRQAEGILSYCHFVYGFRLGVRLMNEFYQEE